MEQHEQKRITEVIAILEGVRIDEFVYLPPQAEKVRIAAIALRELLATAKN